MVERLTKNLLFWWEKGSWLSRYSRMFQPNSTMHAGGEGTSELNVVRSTSSSALDRKGDHKRCKVFRKLCA